MRIVTLPFALLAVSALPFVACDSDDPEDEVELLTYQGTIVDAANSQPVAGVEVCIVSPTGIPCVTTDAAGHYVLENLPATTDVQATVEKDGYFSVFASFTTRTSDFTIDAAILQTDLVVPVFAGAGITLDLAKGAILVRAYDPAQGLTSTVVGITGEISPDQGDGPVYNDEALFGQDTATTESGTWAVVNLDAGTYQVKSSGAGRTCPGTFHWDGSNGADWIETPVRAGFVTYVYVDCPTTN